MGKGQWLDYCSRRRELTLTPSLTGDGRRYRMQQRRVMRRLSNYYSQRRELKQTQRTMMDRRHCGLQLEVDTRLWLGSCWPRRDSTLTPRILNLHGLRYHGRQGKDEKEW